MKKLILFFTIIFSSNILYCQLSAVFVFDKDSIAAYSCVNELTKCKKFKNINFRIIHFNEINSNKNSFISNKMKVDVKNEKLSCDFNFCNSLEGILNSDFASSLFLYSKNSLTCTFNQVKLDEIIINNSFTNDFVKEKINYQLLNYKKNSKSTTLYFNYCNLNNNLITPKINIQNDSISASKGEVINLNLKLSSTHQSISWEPKTGLSCSNCISPEIKVDKSILYTVQYLDKNGCKSNTQEIHINVIDECDYSKNLIIPFGKINFSTIKKVEEETFEYEIKPIGIGGGYRFDIPTTMNCAENFKLIIKDVSSGKTIFVDNKKLVEIDENSNHPFIKDNPNYFVFRINLKDCSKDVNGDKIIIIESYDDKGTKYKSYTSPVVSFSGCK